MNEFAQSNRQFHIGTIISIATGILLCPRTYEHPIDGVYDILDYMEGHDHWTHELPSACERVRPSLLAQFPWLAGITKQAIQDALKATTDYMTVVDGFAATYGEFHEVKRSLLERNRSPIETAETMMGKGRVIAVDASGIEAED